MKRRYYEVILSQDLLGDWCLQRIWGTFGTRLGQVRKQLVKSYKEGEKAIASIATRRRYNGYILINQRLV